MKQLLFAAAAASALALPSAALAQDSPLTWAARLEQTYRIVPNVTYLTASNWEAKLDLYVTRTPDKPQPTLIYIHGGGWTGGTKEGSATGFAAYLEMPDFQLEIVEGRTQNALELCRRLVRLLEQLVKDFKERERI